MATGANYPTTQDSWADKASDGSVSNSDINARTMAIEQLEIRLDRFRKNSARARISADQSITNITATALALDVEDFDTGGLHSNTTNNSRFTAVVAGKYYVCGGAEFTANATGERRAYILKNGTTAYAEERHTNNGGSWVTTLNVSDIVDLAVGDYVEIFVYHSKGSALTTVAANLHTFGSIAYVGE